MPSARCIANVPHIVPPLQNTDIVYEVSQVQRNQKTCTVYCQNKDCLPKTDSVF